MDTTCLEHNTVEEDIKIFGQAAGAREEGRGIDRMKGGRTSGKYRKNGKPAALERSLATNRTPGSYHGGCNCSLVCLVLLCGADLNLPLVLCNELQRARPHVQLLCRQGSKVSSYG